MNIQKITNMEGSKMKKKSNEIIMSIKPKFVYEMYIGNKLYEFRKQFPNVDTVIIYESFPVQRITGYFKVGEVIKDKPVELWNSYHHVGGISKSEFFKYYEGKKQGIAIQIHKLYKFIEPIDPREISVGFSSPQSYCYNTLFTIGLHESYKVRRLK